MIEDTTHTGILRPQELEAVYAISRTVSTALDTETALHEISRLVRPVFIFDNIVLYEIRANGTLEPSYARAIGRGRFREADLTWGEFIANDVFQEGQTVFRVESTSPEVEDRTEQRFLLGLPLILGGQVKAALVFIRFGGPPYAPDQIHLAEFIATHVTQLLEHKQLVERIASLEARRRLDSLQDGFIAMISHELLTPLGFIKGYATTLLREDTTWDDASRREFLQIIDDESDRLRELIDNLLDSSRLQAGTMHMNFQPLKLDPFLKDVVLRGSSSQENLQIFLELDTPGLQIQGDPTRLAQVFDNLISNAVKYAPGSPVLITLCQEAGQARISVADQGPGIAAEHLGNIFNRFYRVPGGTTLARGSGLGLYICRHIVEAHHGDIQVESIVGQGTKFIITLPCESSV